MVTNYVNDVNLPYAQTLMTSDANGTYRGVYTYGLERISESDQVAVEGVPNDPLFYLYDGRGSVTQLVNTANNVRDKYRYTPFGVPMPGGQLTPNTRLFNNPYGYNGEDYDIESGLQFLRARYYNPETARFITRDSYLGDVMEPLSLNRYAYTINNPLKYTDPSGHEPRIGDTSPEGVKSQNQITKDYWTEKSTSKPNSSVKSQPIYKLGSKGDAIVNLQKMLKALGYDVGKHGADGKYGDDTYKAVRSFEKANGLGVNGEVDTNDFAVIKRQYDEHLAIAGIGISSYGMGINNYVAEKTSQSKNVSKNDVGCGGNGDISSGSDTNAGIYTWEEADKYINERVFGISVGHELYSASEISDLPEQITYEKHGYTYTYMLDEHHGYFMGGKLPTLPDYKTQDGKVLSFKQYEYKLAYTDEPEVLTGTVYIGGLGEASKWSSEKGIYSVDYEVNLPKDMYPGVSSSRHFQEANKQLYEAFQKDSRFAQQMEELYPGINKGVEPGARGAFSRNAPTKDVTWHHNADREGVLQLVPRNQHKAPGLIQKILHPDGRGGMENWGGGR